MANVIFDLLLHPVFSATFFGWFAAQMLKIALVAFRGGKVGTKSIWKLGGMPSSHTALVSALVASILFTEGPTTTFVVALVFAMVVFRDAVGVRLAVGKHADALNKLLLTKDKIEMHEGHTVPQAIVGAIIGILAAAFVVGFQYSSFFFVQVSYLALPAIAANGAPILAKLWHPKFDKPIDGNAKFAGKPLFGKNKTWRGIIAGIIAGVLVVILQTLLYQLPAFRDLSLFNYAAENPLIVGLAVSAFVLGADLLKSFVKRRFGIAPGGSFFPWDQLDAVAGGLIALSIFWFPFWEVIITAVVLGLFLSFVMNAARQELGW